MPTVGSLEQYRQMIAASNVGFQSMWLLVLIGLLGIVLIRPYIQRQHLFYGVIAVGIILRISILGRSTWYDEVFSAAVVKAPDFWGAILGDVHPPLAYTIIKAFSLFIGTSEAALRIPSLIASIALIYAVYRLAWNLTGEISTAQTAAGLVALLGAPISYSAEARHPAMLALAVIVAMLGLYEGRQWLFVVGAVTAAYFHAIGTVYTGLLVLVAFMRWPKTAIAVFLLSSLWVPVMMLQQGQVADGFWLEPQSPLKHVVEMTLFTMDGVPSDITAIAYVIVIGWSIVGVYMSRDWLKKRGGVWGVVAVGVPLVLAVISTLWHPVYLSRALLAPALLLVIAWACAWPRLHWVWRGLLICAVVLSWSGVVIPVSEDERHMPDTKAMFARCAGADYVYASSTNMAIQALVYSPVPVRVLQAGNNIDQQLSDDAKGALGMMLVPDATAIPPGEVCLIAQISHRTTPEEKAEVERIRREHTLLQDETLSTDKFYAYQLMRWINHGSSTRSR